MPIAFMDTETTGVHHDRLVWEVAAVRYDDDGTRTERTFMIDPVDLSRAEPFGLGIGGFYQRHPQGRWLSKHEVGAVPADLNSYPAAEAAEMAARLLHGAVVVGIVPGFDTEVLGDLLRGHKLTSGWHYHPQDMESDAAGWLAARGVALPPPPWKSDDLSRLCGVKPPTDDERHTALGDAAWCERWWLALGMPIPGPDAATELPPVGQTPSGETQ